MFWTRKKERNLFAFQDGARKKRQADPLRVWQAIQDELGTDIKDVVIGAEKGDLESIDLVTKAVRKAFNVKEWSEETPEGLSLGELLGLFGEFLRFVDDVKKKRGPLPSFQEPTEPPKTSPPPSDSDSTSTDTESKDKKQRITF